MMNTEDDIISDACGLRGNVGDEVMRSIGSLDELADNFEDEDFQDEVDPKTVGSWITIVGRAILAIFKP